MKSRLLLVTIPLVSISAIAGAARVYDLIEPRGQDLQAPRAQDVQAPRNVVQGRTTALANARRLVDEAEADPCVGGRALAESWAVPGLRPDRA